MIPKLKICLVTQCVSGRRDRRYIDIAAYAGSIAYTPVSHSSRFCEFTISGYTFGSSKFVTTNLDAITDIGTTLLLLPAVTAYWTQTKYAYLKDIQGISLPVFFHTTKFHVWYR
jgi:hypothetical protein